MYEPFWMTTTDPEIQFSVSQCTEGHWHAMFLHQGEAGVSLHTWESEPEALIAGRIELEMMLCGLRGIPWNPELN